jgi:hypothetical protein
MASGGEPVDESFDLCTIELPDSLDEDDFEQFVLTSVFLDIPKEPTRAGRVEGLALYKGANTGVTNRYMITVSGTIGFGSALSGLDRIREFGAKVTEGHKWSEVGRWPERAEEG